MGFGRPKGGRMTRMRKSYRARIQRKLNKTEKSQVKKMISNTVEHKLSDTNQLTLAAISTTTAYLDLSSIIIGDQPTQRSGWEIKPVKLEVNLQIVGSSGTIVAGDQYNTVRVIFFRWVPDNSLFGPTDAEILAESTAPVVSLYQISNKNQYKIIGEKRIVVNYVEGTVSPVVVWKKFSFKLKGKCRYIFGAGVGTGGNHVYMSIVSDSSVSPHPQYTMSARLTYMDA